MAHSQDPSHDWENLKGSSTVMCKEKLEMGVKEQLAPVFSPSPPLQSQLMGQVMV